MKNQRLIRLFRTRSDGKTIDHKVLTQDEKRIQRELDYSKRISDRIKSVRRKSYGS